MGQTVIGNNHKLIRRSLYLLGMLWLGLVGLAPQAEAATISGRVYCVDPAGNPVEAAIPLTGIGVNVQVQNSTGGGPNYATTTSVPAGQVYGSFSVNTGTGNNWTSGTQNIEVKLTNLPTGLIARYAGTTDPAIYSAVNCAAPRNRNVTTPRGTYFNACTAYNIPPGNPGDDNNRSMCNVRAYDGCIMPANGSNNIFNFEIYNCAAPSERITERIKYYSRFTDNATPSLRRCDNIPTGLAVPGTWDYSNIATLVDFEQGVGYPYSSSASPRYYKGPVYYCCFENSNSFSPILGCENIQAPTPNVGSENPYLAVARGETTIRSGISVPQTELNCDAPFNTYYYCNFQRQSRASEFTYTTFQSLRAGESTSMYSFQRFVVENLLTPASRPPLLSGFGADWYSYLFRLTEVNLSLSNLPAMKQIPSASANCAAAGCNSNTNLSALFGCSAAGDCGGVTTFRIKGNLNLQAGSRCNVKALIFVEGNITMDTNFDLANVSDLTKGCLFIVKGNGLINSTAEALTYSGQDNRTYESLRAGLLVQGLLTIPRAGGNFAEQKRALVINGLLASDRILSNRDTRSVYYPSLRVDYDPRYLELFKRELRFIKFSAREKGLVSNLPV